MFDEIKETPEVQETNEQPQQTQPEATQSENLNANHLVAMRRKLEAAEQRAANLERQLQDNNQRPAQEPTETEDFGDLDDVATNKRLASTHKKLSSRQSESDKKVAALEQKLSYFEAKSEIDSIKDFNDVVTDDNLKTFARLYPDDYETVMANPNLKSKSKTAYNMIKNYGIAQNPLTKQLDQMKTYDKKIESNKAKPNASASAPVSGSPLVKYGRYNEEGRLEMTEDEARKVHLETRRKLGIM